MAYCLQLSSKLESKNSGISMIVWNVVVLCGFEGGIVPCSARLLDELYFVAIQFQDTTGLGSCKITKIDLGSEEILAWNQTENSFTKSSKSFFHIFMFSIITASENVGEHKSSNHQGQHGLKSEFA